MSAAHDGSLARARRLGQPFDRVEAAVPVPGELRHRPRRVVEWPGVDLISDLASLFAAAHETHVFEPAGAC
jgi:hypothetical protein